MANESFVVDSATGQPQGLAQFALNLEQRPDRRAFVLERARGQAWQFRPDFTAWLTQNFHVWTRFEREANQVYACGRRHYSARTIGEYLRHETALQAKDDGEWKLNDHRWPDLARLYLMLYPERDGFFELRRGEARR